MKFSPVYFEILAPSLLDTEKLRNAFVNSAKPSLWTGCTDMGMKGVRKLSGKIFRNVCKRDRDLWRSYEDACQNDIDFLVELGKFLESYEKCLIHIKDEGTDDGFVRILGKMKNINGASGRDHDQYLTDQMLLEKVKCLMTHRENLHKELIDQKYKPRNKYACTHAGRRCLKLVTHVVFIGAAAAEFACTIVAAVMAAPLVALAIAAAIIPTLAGQHWTLSWVKNYEVPFKYPDNVIRLMEARTVLSIKELGEIQTYLCGVVKDIESLVSHLNSVTEGDVNLNMKSIECLLKNIEELMERARNCKSLILDARDEVSTSIYQGHKGQIKE